MAAGEETMLHPRAPYRGSLAGWIPLWQYTFAGRCMKGFKWPSCVVHAKDGAITQDTSVGVCW